MLGKLIENEHEAIEAIKSNMPTSGYYMLRESLEMAIQALEEIQQYREIGTVEECREAVEKQKPKEPTVLKQQHSDFYKCPKCGRNLILKCGTDWFGGQHYKSCPNCGQAIRWDENLEGMRDE